MEGACVTFCAQKLQLLSKKNCTHTNVVIKYSNSIAIDTYSHTIINEISDLKCNMSQKTEKQCIIFYWHGPDMEMKANVTPKKLEIR